MSENKQFQDQDILDELGIPEETVQEEKHSEELVKAYYDPAWNELRTMLTSMGISQDAQLQHFGRNGKNVAQILVDNEKLKKQELRFKFKEIDYEAQSKYHYQLLLQEKKRADKLEELRYRRALESGQLDNAIEIEFKRNLAIDNAATEIERLRKENTRLKLQNYHSQSLQNKDIKDA